VTVGYTVCLAKCTLIGKNYADGFGKFYKGFLLLYSIFILTFQAIVQSNMTATTVIQQVPVQDPNAKTPPPTPINIIDPDEISALESCKKINGWMGLMPTCIFIVVCSVALFKEVYDKQPKAVYETQTTVRELTADDLKLKAKEVYDKKVEKEYASYRQKMKKKYEDALKELSNNPDLPVRKLEELQRRADIYNSSSQISKDEFKKKSISKSKSGRELISGAGTDSDQRSNRGFMNSMKKSESPASIVNDSDLLDD